MIWGGHEPRVYAAVCFWLCRGSRGHQLCCTGLSVCAAASSLLCLYRWFTCPAFLTLLTQTQQVLCLCMYIVFMFVNLVLSLSSVAMQSQCCCHVGVLQSDAMRLHTKSRSSEDGEKWQSHT